VVFLIVIDDAFASAIGPVIMDTVTKAAIKIISNDVFFNTRNLKPSL
jgi:hypothetical protein